MRAEVLAFLQALALVAIAVVVSTLPDATFNAARGALLVASALMLGAIALSVVVRPMRGALFGLFGVPHVEEGPLIATPEEMRALVRPLLLALGVMGVALFATLLR